MKLLNDPKKNGKYRPRLLFRLLRLFAPKEDVLLLKRNFEEVYASFSQRKGKKAARWFLFAEIARSVPGIFTASISWRIAMLSNTVKVALRHIARFKLYSVINIAGLTVGLAAVMLILLYIQFEISFDRFHEHADRIYRVEVHRQNEERKSSLTPAPLAPAMQKDFPEVIAATRLYNQDHVHLHYEEKNMFEDGFIYADPEIFDIFSLKLKRGDAETALEEPFSVILSESMAEKYFGTEDPVGKTVRVRESMEFTVTGILEDLPEHSHFSIHFLIPVTTLERMNSLYDLTNWGASSYKTYFLLREDAAIQRLSEKIPAFLGSHMGENVPAGFEVQFQPLSRIHLFSNTTGEISKTGDIRVLYISASIALIILLLACINYMNMATARSSRRAREIGVRKAVGARRSQLIRQFIGESMTFTLIAFILAYFLAGLILPAFNDFAGTNLQLNLIRNWRFIPWIAGLILAVGFISGSYPAFAISSVRPVSIFQGRFTGLGGHRLRTVLVVIQFCVSVLLIAGSFGMKRQLDFVRRSDPGFHKEDILVIDIRDAVLRSHLGAIKQDFLRSPEIQSASAFVFLPHATNAATIADWPGKDESIEQEIFINFVDYDYLDVFGIDLVEGRNFSREHPSDTEGAFLLNESAAREIGWESALGKSLTHFVGRRTGRVVGIVKDFHMLSLHDPIGPLCIDLNPESNFRQLAIRYTGEDVSAIIPYVRETLARYNPNYPFVLRFMDDIYDAAYRVELKMHDLLNVSALLAVFIACMGLFGLSAFTLEHRTKEIGVRKILGASSPGIVFMVSKQMIRWIIVSNLIAWPFAYLILDRWLQEFAYRSNPGFFVFVSSGGIAFFVGLFTVMVQAWKAVRANAVEALRYE